MRRNFMFNFEHSCSRIGYKAFTMQLDHFDNRSKKKSLFMSLGTIIGGLISCCYGRPRYDFRPAKLRCPTSLLVVAIGFAQMASTLFMLVGWLWSIIWGVLLVNLSGEEFRKTPSPPPDPRARRELKVEVPIPAAAPEAENEPATRGKKNFMKLVSKANDNMDQAIHGPTPSLSSSTIENDNNLKNKLIGGPNAVIMDPKQLSSNSVDVKSEEPYSVKLSSSKKSLSFVNEISSAPAIIEVEESGMTEKEEDTPMSIGSKYAIFGCFRAQDHNSMLHEKFIKMMRGGSIKDSQMNLLPNYDSPTLSSLRARGEEFIGNIHRLFTHWKNRATEATRSRLRNIKVENLTEKNSNNELESVAVISNEAHDTGHAELLPSLIIEPSPSQSDDFDYTNNEIKTSEPQATEAIEVTVKMSISTKAPGKTKMVSKRPNINSINKASKPAVRVKPNVTSTGHATAKMTQKRSITTNKTISRPKVKK
ncbi:hypothetical protein CHUAL_005215 [Chamberlinius hualienensis]